MAVVAGKGDRGYPWITSALSLVWGNLGAVSNKGVFVRGFLSVCFMWNGLSFKQVKRVV